MMLLKFLLATIAVLGSFKAAVPYSSAGHGKSICMNEDLLQMLIGMNNGKKDNSGLTEKPVFFASLKNHVVYNVNQVYLFDDVKTNIGNHYNPLTGEFTAPRDGIYQMYCVIMATGVNGVHYQLNKNDNLFANGYTSKSDAGSSTNIWIMDLKKDDRVYIKHRGNPQSVHGHYSYFGGFLLL